MSKLKRKIKTQEERTREAEEVKRMFDFFCSIWDERMNDRGECVCFETGQVLRRSKYRDNMACYHHLLHKETHEEYKYCKENIVILVPFIHNQVHWNYEKTPKVMELTKTLKQKHIDGRICE